MATTAESDSITLGTLAHLRHFELLNFRDSDRRRNMKKAAIVLGLTLILGYLNAPALADYYSREFGDMDANYDDYVDFDE